MNAVEVVRADHKEILGLMEQINIVEDEVGEIFVNAESFNELRNAVRTHIMIEEEIFYPAIEGFNETRSLVRDAYNEHHMIDQLLNQLSTLPWSEADAHGKLADLKTAISRHVDKVEDKILPEAERLLSISDMEELGRRMGQAKSGRAVTAAGRKK
jgi:hemerythrin-like domain-containing protein